MNIDEWKSKGQYTKVYGHSVFNIHLQHNQPTIAFLHGYPSASFDYYKVLPFIEKDYSCIIHDHLGFGLSDKPVQYSYSLIEQAEIAMELWKQLGLKEIHLVSHDYGTTVANEIIVRSQQGFEPVKLKSVTFCNGSMHIELAHLKLVQKLLKHPVWGKYIVAMMNKHTFIKTMQDIWFDPVQRIRRGVDVVQLKLIGVRNPHDPRIDARRQRKRTIILADKRCGVTIPTIHPFSMIG